MRHPNSAKSLTRFAQGSSSREEGRSIVAHLLEGCAACAAGVRTAFQPEIPAGAYDEVFDRLRGSLLSRAEGEVLPFRRPAVPVPAAARAQQAGRARR